MTTKVKGNKIKEGSIPLSALAEDVKGEFNGKYGLSGYCGTLGRDNKTVDTNVYFRGNVYIKHGNETALVSIGTYTIHELFPSSASIPGNIVVYAKGEKLSLDLQEDSNYWGALKVFRELYEVPIPTPDWNAQDGDPGYIENRTHYFEINHKQFLDLQKVEEGSYLYEDFVNQGYEELDNIFVSPIYNDSSYNIVIYCTKDIIVTDNTDTKFSIKILDTKTDFSVGIIDKKRMNRFNVRLFKHINEDGDIIYYVVIYCLEVNHDTIKQSVDECICLVDNINDDVTIRTLDDIFIPDTVLKTTPQTLSDTDKNQALANLGIKTIVAKQYRTIPSELLDRDADELLYQNPNYYIFEEGSKKIAIAEVGGDYLKTYDGRFVRAINLGDRYEWQIDED